jgi:Leucine-rich repeat (LRR) protein
MSLLETCISRFKYLRVLDLSCSSMEVLSSSIGILRHLSYLNLCDNVLIKELPNSICKLYKLQTLLLSGCHGLERLPKDISNMINLRFLVVPTTMTFLLENGVGCLNSLQTLVIVECLNLKCKYLFGRTDGCLTSLQTLVLDRCPFLTSLSLSTNHLTTLEILIIHDCGNLSLIEGEDNQNLKLSLKKLYLKRLQKVVVLPQWLQGSANTLQHLKIEDCDNFAAFPEWLPSLTSLQTLKITNCPKLSSLPEGMQHITTLRELMIEGCPELSRKCRQEDRLKIAHVPHIHLSDASVERQVLISQKLK